MLISLTLFSLEGNFLTVQTQNRRKEAVMAQLFKTNDVVSYRFVKIYIEWYANMLKFFAEKNVSSFCSAKATHIFSAKNIRILHIESTKTVNEMTINELVKLTTLWTTGPRTLFRLFPWEDNLTQRISWNMYSPCEGARGISPSKKKENIYNVKIKTTMFFVVAWKWYPLISKTLNPFSL